MLRTTLMLAAVAAASPALAQPPGSGGNPLQVEVNNEVDARVINATPAPDLARVGGASGIGGGEGALVFFSLAEGKLYGASMSVHSSVDGDRCVAEAAVIYGDTFTGDRKTIGLGAMSFGETQSVSQSYTAPIEVITDDAGRTPTLAVFITAPASICFVHFTAQYAPDEPAVAAALSDAAPMKVMRAPN